ncbi:MAG: hypothetical protein HQK49_02055 [Oligoflexia bacterium]|nr:hypothetical protein [Oligoflexia bacterium]
MFINISLNFTTGFFIHYATYMAGRTYLVADESNRLPANADNEAKVKAQQVFSQIFTSLFKSGSSKLVMTKGAAADLLQFQQLYDRAQSRKSKLFTGVFFEFEQKMVVPAIGGGPILKLRSEAYLGKEPLRGECLDRITELFKIGFKNSSTNNICITLFDDGC